MRTREQSKTCLTGFCVNLSSPGLDDTPHDGVRQLMLRRIVDGSASRFEISHHFSHRCHGRLAHLAFPYSTRKVQPIRKALRASGRAGRIDPAKVRPAPVVATTDANTYGSCSDFTAGIAVTCDAGAAILATACVCTVRNFPDIAARVGVGCRYRQCAPTSNFRSIGPWASMAV